MDKADVERRTKELQVIRKMPDKEALIIWLEDYGPERFAGAIDAICRQMMAKAKQFVDSEKAKTHIAVMERPGDLPTFEVGDDLKLKWLDEIRDFEPNPNVQYTIIRATSFPQYAITNGLHGDDRKDYAIGIFWTWFAYEWNQGALRMLEVAMRLPEWKRTLERAEELEEAGVPRDTSLWPK